MNSMQWRHCMTLINEITLINVQARQTSIFHRKKNPRKYVCYLTTPFMYMCVLYHQWYSENEGGNGAAPSQSHGHECHKGSHSRPTLPKRGQSRRVSAAGRALSPHPARHAGQGCSRGASSLRKLIGCPGTPRLGATRERPVSRVREA